MSARFFSSYAGRGILLAALIAVLDQLSKWAVLVVLAEVPSPRIIASFFNIVLVWNRGISFGILAHGSTTSSLLLGLLALGIVGFLLRWLYKSTTLLCAHALGLVIGGAIGNIIDRVRFGAVVDFLDLHVAGVHWPAFNLADSAICIGVIMLIWDGMRRPKSQ